MPDGDEFMQEPGGDDGPPPDEEKALAYLADAPEWAVIPPGGNVFANATWLEAGAQYRALVDRVLAFEEFEALRGLSMGVYWRRKSKPQRKARWGDEPIVATVEIVAPRMTWIAYAEGCETFPRLLIDLHWQWFEERRDEGFYVHADEVARDIHHALSALEVTNDIVSKVQPDVAMFAATVQRYGVVNPGLRKLRQQFALWPDDSEEG